MDEKIVIFASINSLKARIRGGVPLGVPFGPGKVFLDLPGAPEIESVPSKDRSNPKNTLFRLAISSIRGPKNRNIRLKDRLDSSTNKQTEESRGNSIGNY